MLDVEPGNAYAPAFNSTGRGHRGRCAQRADDRQLHRAPIRQGLELVTVPGTYHVIARRTEQGGPPPTCVLRAAVDCSGKPNPTRCELPLHGVAGDSLTFLGNVDPFRLIVKGAGQDRCFTSGSPATIQVLEPGMEQIGRNDPVPRACRRRFQRQGARHVCRAGRALWGPVREGLKTYAKAVGLPE